MDENQLFPVLPEDLSSLTEAELQAHLDASMAAKDKIVAQDPEFLGDLDATAILETMKAGVAGILALKAEQASRVEAQENLASELSSLAAQVAPELTLAAETEDEEGDDGADDDGADDPDAAATLAAETPVEEPIVAAAEPEAPKPILRRSAPAATGLDRLAPEAYSGMTLTASSDLDGSLRAGQPLDPRDGDGTLNRALVSAIRRKTSAPPGFRDEVIVASADISDRVPEYRRLRLGDTHEQSNEDKVRALTAAADRAGVGIPDGMEWGEAEALTASGGICAPVTPYYELAFVSSMQRPVRDSLVGFIGDRGGINYAPPPYLSQITTGVGVMTATQDANGSTKTCQTLICPSFTSVDVQQIWHCFTGGNLGARAFPEQAAQFSSLILAQHARVCETQLLNQIKTGSTQVEGQSTVLGAISSLLNDVLTAAAAYRSNNRMPRNAPLQALMPQWTGDLLLIDLLQSQFDRFDKTQAGLEALFGAFGINVTFYMDGPTDGQGQVLERYIGGQSMEGTFPTVVEWALFHPGGVLFVDSGVLELGIVRDSVLNAENSYQVWGESFEVAVVVAVQSLWITSNVCASGAVTLPVTNLHQCGT